MHNFQGKRSGYASDELDDTDGDDRGGQPAGKKRKLSKAALAKLKAKEKAKESAKEKAKYKAKKGKKKGANDDEDYEDEDEDEDEYTALSKGGFTRGGARSVLPPAGSFENCAECEKKFTVVRVFPSVYPPPSPRGCTHFNPPHSNRTFYSCPTDVGNLQTRYTMAANPGPGFLCHKCAKASGADPFKKPAAPRKRKDQAEKRKVTSFEETERVKSLAKMCIEVSR